MKKRISIFLALGCLTASIAFAAPIITIRAAPSICINSGPITLYAEGDTAGATAYKWRYYRPSDTTWVVDSNSTGPTLVVDSFPTYERAYIVTVTINGHPYSPQHPTVLCHCTTVGLSIESFTGSIQYGVATLNWKTTDAHIVYLQHSLDGRTWQETDVTGTTTTSQPLSVMMQFRLRIVAWSGEQKVSDIKILKPKLTSYVPTLIRVTDMGGRLVKTVKVEPNSDSPLVLITTTPELKALPKGTYAISFYQNEKLVESVGFIQM